MSFELIRYQRDKNLGELYATPPNGKCLIVRIILVPAGLLVANTKTTSQNFPVKLDITR